MGVHATQNRSAVHLSLPAVPENVAVVRHVMLAFGDALDLPCRMVEDVRLAVTEACTNVVRHAYDHEHGVMDIHIDPHSDRLDIAVADAGRGMGASGDFDGPGFGLPMMATLADSLEIDRTTGSGSRVAMSFSRSPAPLGAS
jgi:serine/threonine-protein kinase RsbW